jgi:hypothetical protein
MPVVPRIPGCHQRAALRELDAWLLMDIGALPDGTETRWCANMISSAGRNEVPIPVPIVSAFDGVEV